MNATYGFVYSGFAGVGMGIFRVIDSALIGVDFAGSKYKGTVVEHDTDELIIEIQMTVPSGVFLVQGTSAQDVPYAKTASVKVPADFGDGKPFEVYFAPGTVTMMVKRIPDDFSTYADGVTVDIRPAASR